MMKTLRLGLAVLALLWAGPGLALDAGTASGHYVREGRKFEFAHAIALSQDNTEGLLDHGPQVRVLLSDREVPIQALYGIAFPPVRAMAREGAVRGLLLEFDPADRTSLRITILAKPDDPSEFAPNLSLTNSEGLWTRLEASATRIVGDYRSSDEDRDMAFVFSAPVFTDAVQADLKGADAQKSEQVRVLIARAEAIGRGDLPAALALSSRQSAQALGAMPAEALKEAKGSMAPFVKELKAIKRVVVRRETAVALMSEGSWSSLVLEDGAWKVAD
jgi:hypothetical protein